MAMINPTRGEIWKVTFRDPTGQEIGKSRPALVMNMPKFGRAALRIVVPITTGREQHAHLPWMIRVRADSANRLDHDSFADASQVQPASIKRFLNMIGTIQDTNVLDKVAGAVALCVGYSHGRPRRRRK